MRAFGREAKRDASLLAFETAQNGASEICVHIDRPESLDGGGCPSFQWHHLAIRHLFA